MNTVQPNNSDKVLTLKQAAAELSVSVAVLLDWNEHNILKPTITPEGEIGYTQTQLDQFLTIKKLLQETEENVSLKPAIHIQALSGVSMLSENKIHISFKPEIDTYHHVSAADWQNGTPPPLVLLSFAVIIVVLTIGIFPKQGVQTSKLNLSEQISAALPIQLKNEPTIKKNLHNEGESISQEKISAPALYATNAKNENVRETKQMHITVASSSPKQVAGVSDMATGDSYASSGDFGEPCSSCSDETAAIDELGNIKGEAKTDTLATIVGGIDEIIRGDGLKQRYTDATNQVIFVFIGALAVLFVFQKQFTFAYPTKKLPEDAFVPYRNHPEIPQQKALEIDQKTDGTVVLYVEGQEYKISKPEMNSESDQFIEQLMSLTQPGMQEIEYDALQSNARLTTPLSRLVTRLGFVGVKRDLFFPRTSKNSVLFRKYLTPQDLAQMNLTTTQILDDLTAISS